MGSEEIGSTAVPVEVEAVSPLIPTILILTVAQT